MGLPEIVARVAKSEWDEALDLALAAWGETRAPAYANLIEAISSRISRAAIPTHASDYGYDQVQHRWISRARSLFAIDIPVLLDVFAIDLRAHETRAEFDQKRASGRVRAAMAKENLSLDPSAQGAFMAIAIRLDLLAGFKPDPRMAKGLARFLKLAPVAVEGPLAVATYGPVFDFIAWVGDVRVVPTLEALPPSKARDRALEALRATVIAPLPDEEDVMTLAKDLGFTEAAPALDVKELLEMVVADLDDDTPRAILGDLWLEAGDPRGELVQLQLRAARRELTAAELARMESLEAQNQLEWLGDLALLTSARRFHRGFLDEISLAADATAPRARWQAAMRDARLGTVRTLRPGAASDRLFREMLYAPALRNLEAAEIATPTMLRQFVEAEARPPKLRRIALATHHFGIETARAEVEPLIQLGLSVSITYARAAIIVDFLPLLGLATTKSSVTLQGIDARFTAKRTAEGLSLDIVSRDAKLVDAALEACRDAVVTVSRPRGAKLYGPDGTTRRLANFLRANAHRNVSLDASWTEMLRR